MATQKIEPHRVTKPIQLLAAWLVGLVLTNAAFLATAIQLPSDSWQAKALVIASVTNVPVFLLAMFVLQTRFRAELQEDAFYAEYLSKKTAAIVRVDRDASQDARIQELERMILDSFEKGQQVRTTSDTHVESQTKELAWADWPIALNFHHPQYNAITEALGTAQIPIAEVFGSDKPPTKWVISINPELPPEHKIHLLRTLLPFHFDGIEFSFPRREIDETEDVYIGGYTTQRFTPLTEGLTRLIKGPNARLRLDQVIRKQFK